MGILRPQWQPSRIPKALPVELRTGYVPGAGQLCETCFADLYPTNKGL